MRLLVVVDYAPLASSIAQGLREEGYSVDVTGSGSDGLSYARSAPYDLMILDLMLPDLDGRDLLRTLRSEGVKSPVLILTAKDTIADRVACLDLGADDYMVKPFSFAELAARVRALVRRGYRVATSTIQIADLEIEPSSRTVRRAGVPISLSSREYRLLEYLALRRGDVVTRGELWEHLYDFASEPQSNVLDVYVRYLRKKIDDDHPVRLIQTRRGHGYLLDVPE